MATMEPVLLGSMLRAATPGTLLTCSVHPLLFRALSRCISKD